MTALISMTKATAGRFDEKSLSLGIAIMESLLITLAGSKILGDILVRALGL